MLAITVALWQAALCHIAWNHRASPAEIIVSAVKLVGLLIEQDDGEDADAVADKHADDSEEGVERVPPDHVICQHNEEKSKETTHAVKGCEAEARRDWEDDLCHELIKIETKCSCD